MVYAVSDNVTLPGDGQLLHPISVNIAFVVDGLGFDLWNGAREHHEWVKTHPRMAESRRKVPSTAPIQVPGQVWARLYKAGAKAVKSLGEKASMEAMEVAGQRACVASWNKLLHRLDNSVSPKPRRLWNGVPRTTDEIANDDNPCLIGKCAAAQKGQHWSTSVGCENILAHRLSLTLASGICPAGMVARHRCGARGCINSTHLLWGTAMDNHLDKARDGMARHKDGRLMTYEEYAAELAWPYEAPTTAERLKRGRKVLKAVARSQGRKM